MGKETEPMPCAICGKESFLFCGKCKTTYYCCREHQKQDWKEHKKSCGKVAPITRAIVVGDQCTRCLEIIQGDSNGNHILNNCKVPHSEDLQKCMGTSFGPDGVEVKFLCQGCNSNYQRSSRNRHAPTSFSSITSGPKWCYEGEHTIQPVERLDERRVKKDLVVIRASSRMQQEINNLNGNEEVTILRICSDGPFITAGHLPLLDISLPNLR